MSPFDTPGPSWNTSSEHVKGDFIDYSGSSYTEKKKKMHDTSMFDTGNFSSLNSKNDKKINDINFFETSENESSNNQMEGLKAFESEHGTIEEKKRDLYEREMQNKRNREKEIKAAQDKLIELNESIQNLKKSISKNASENLVSKDEKETIVLNKVEETINIDPTFFDMTIYEEELVNKLKKSEKSTIEESTTVEGTIEESTNVEGTIEESTNVEGTIEENITVGKGINKKMSKKIYKRDFTELEQSHNDMVNEIIEDIEKEGNFSTEKEKKDELLRRLNDFNLPEKGKYIEYKGEKEVSNRLEKIFSVFDKAISEGDSLGAKHCTDFIDKGSLISTGKSIYNYPSLFNGVDYKPESKIGTGLLVDEYASKDLLSQVGPGSHLIIDDGEGEGNTHSIFVRSKPLNSIVEAYSYPNKGDRPPELKYFDLSHVLRIQNI